MRLALGLGWSALVGRAPGQAPNLSLLSMGPGPAWPGLPELITFIDGPWASPALSHFTSIHIGKPLTSTGQVRAR